MCQRLSSEGGGIEDGEVLDDKLVIVFRNPINELKADELPYESLNP